MQGGAPLCHPVLLFAGDVHSFSERGIWMWVSGVVWCVCGGCDPPKAGSQSAEEWTTTRIRSTHLIDKSGDGQSFVRNY